MQCSKPNITAGLGLSHHTKLWRLLALRRYAWFWRLRLDRGKQTCMLNEVVMAETIGCVWERERVCLCVCVHVYPSAWKSRWKDRSILARPAFTDHNRLEIMQPYSCLWHLGRNCVWTPSANNNVSTELIHGVDGGKRWKRNRWVLSSCSSAWSPKSWARLQFLKCVTSSMESPTTQDRTHFAHRLSLQLHHS